MHNMNNMNANMNNAFIRVNKEFIYSYSRSANMNKAIIRIPLFLSEPYRQERPGQPLSTDSVGSESGSRSTRRRGNGHPSLQPEESQLT